MTFEIVADRLHIGGRPARYVPSRNTGGRILPELIVLHDTAGALRPFSSVEWFQSPKCQTSAHFVVERDGTITQMVDCDRKALHAGESVWNGRRYCNGFAIGIEIVNPGRLHRAGDSCVAEWGGKFPAADCLELTTPEHGRGWWLQYSAEQVEAVTALCAALASSYPTIRDITTHYAISPGRKIDPGPQFPLEDLRAAVDAAMSTTTPAEPAGIPGSLALGASGPLVETAQRSLADLGFLPGAVDGHYGPRTRAAVLAFEAENGLPTDGVLDAADIDLLTATDAKAMPTGGRDETTARDLAAAGSGHMADAGGLTRVGKTLTTGGSIEAGGQLLFGVSPIETAFSFAERGIGLATRLGVGKSMHLRASHVVVLALLAAGWWAWRKGAGIALRRLAEHRLGINIGR